MREILKYAIQNNASDIHITQDKIVWIRIKGEFKKHLANVALSSIDEFAENFLPDLIGNYKNFRNKNNTNPIDGAFEFMDRRFRVNIYYSMNGVNIALRLLSDKILSLDKLYLPESTMNFTKIHSGLVLVVGTTGSGKSTTLAAIIDSINHNRSENILTIESPIEYIHKPDKCRIEQIEVGVHVDSFETATVAAMRQNPNIILVGELRDLATIQNAITLAETGHVVYGTLHAKSVTETADRMIDVFPPKQQEQIRLQLANVLKGVIHQTLVRTLNGGIVPLIEQLVVDDVVSAMILQRQKANAMRDYLRGKSQLGNIHIADNAVWHAGFGRIEIESLKGILTNDDYNMAKAILASTKMRGGFGG